MKRWKVQARVNEPDALPYMPTFHRTKRQARRQVRELERSFGPGMVTITMERVKPRPPLITPP